MKSVYKNKNQPLLFLNDQFLIYVCTYAFSSILLNTQFFFKIHFFFNKIPNKAFKLKYFYIMNIAHIFFHHNICLTFNVLLLLFFNHNVVMCVIFQKFHICNYNRHVYVVFRICGNKISNTYKYKKIKFYCLKVFYNTWL